MTWQEKKSLWRTAIIEFVRANSMMHGAALSYYFMLALVPMLYLLVTYVGMFLGEEETRKIIASFLNEWIGLHDPEAMLGFLDQVDFSKSSLFLQIVGILALLFSCSAIFNSLRNSLNAFLNISKPNIDRRKLMLRKLFTRLLSMSFVVAASVLMVVLYFTQSLFLGLAAGLLERFGLLDSWLFALLNVVIPIFSNLVIFWLIFKYIHDGRVSGQLALRGAILTAFLLFIGQWLIKYYLTHYFFGAHGGLAGTMLIILVWVYYSSQIIFFGAKYIDVYARSKGNPIQHRITND